MIRQFLAAATMLTLAGLPLHAQDRDDDPAVQSGISVDRGAGVFHGNYCGVGDNGPGLPPVDDLDLACMHHDSCTPTGGLPTCACNARFSAEVRRVQANPWQSTNLRMLAGLVQAAIPVIPCQH